MGKPGATRLAESAGCLIFVSILARLASRALPRSFQSLVGLKGRCCSKRLACSIRGREVARAVVFLASDDGFPVSSLISPSKSIAGWSATVTAIACSTTEERLRRNRMIYVIKAKAILLNGEPTSAIALERVQKAIFMFNGGP